MLESLVWQQFEGLDPSAPSKILPNLASLRIAVRVVFSRVWMTFSPKSVISRKFLVNLLNESGEGPSIEVKDNGAGLAEFWVPIPKPPRPPEPRQPDPGPK